MNMSKEIYERLSMDVTEFDVEDVITTSAEIDPAFHAGKNEMAVGFGITPDF